MACSSAVWSQEGESKGSAELGGHLKLQFLGATYSDDSFLRESIGANSADLNLDLRLNLSLSAGKWDFEAHGQLLGLYGDSYELSRGLSARGAESALGAESAQSPLFLGPFPEDRRRLFDLTKVHEEGARFASLSRLDRLSIGYTANRGVVRFGRQAITWGNGFLFTPMDIFNPFDPTAVDKEYKAGDDMFYGQFLRDRGDDLQAVVVFRRDPLTGEVESDVGSAAIKYHALVGSGEIDLLVAEHYGDSLLGVGGNRSVGGAVWRGDLMLAQTRRETIASLVTNLGYSWVWGGKNTSGLIEYFYNGFGQSSGRYSPDELATNPDLLARVGRNELFNLGRHYLAASATVELTPLFLLTPNLFVNVGDPSALLQVVTQNDLRQNLVLQAALTVPIGASGTEYGGVELLPGRFLSTEASLFLQLAWYF